MKRKTVLQILSSRFRLIEIGDNQAINWLRNLILIRSFLEGLTNFRPPDQNLCIYRMQLLAQLDRSEIFVAMRQY